jgi:hypothetical protein
MRRLILAAALAATSASFAMAPAMATVVQPPIIGSTSPDAAGVDDLGLDISGVTLTPAGVHGFIASLPAETRRGVEAACSMYDQHPAGAGEQTLAFCAQAKA